MIKNERVINDPIILHNISNMKNDFLLLKEETLKDFREIEEKIANKYSNLDGLITKKLNFFEERLNILELKFVELSKIFNINKLLEEKISRLFICKEKIEDLILKEKVKLENLIKNTGLNFQKIYEILSDSVIYPRIIGKSCKYKNFHELIDYILNQCSLNLLFREKNNLDLKSYKMKIEKSIKIFNEELSHLINTTNEFTKKYVNDKENQIKKNIFLLEEKIMNIKIENKKNIINLGNYFRLLEKKIKVLKPNDEIIKTKMISEYEDKQMYKKRAKSLKNNIIRKCSFKNFSTKNKIINKINFEKIRSINQRKSDILFNKKNNSFKLYDNFNNNNENKRKSIILANNSQIINNSDLNKYLYNEKTLNRIVENKENNSSVLLELENFKKAEARKSAIINKEMIVSKTLFQKKIDNSKFNYKRTKKSHSISDVLIHNATVVEYNADSKFNKNKTQKYKNQIKSEFRTVDNLILTSYNPKYNNIINNYINKQNF